MNLKVFVNSKISKQTNLMTKTEKRNLSSAIDMMESLGQLGEPLFKEMNVWKYRVENLRIIYKKTPTGIYVLKVLKGTNATTS